MSNTLENLSGQTILITGAAMGMGKMYAHLAVADHAAHVVLWDINAQMLEHAAAEMRGRGAEIHAYAVDVSKLEDIEAAAQKVRDEVGTPDVLINNAGIVRGKYFWEHDQRADIVATMSINTLALMHITREFLPEMIAGGRESRIVNVASAAGLLANPRMSVYSSSKWAVIGWSDSLRLELKQAGHNQIKVTTFCPSYIKTGMFEGARGPLFTPLMEPAAVTERVWRAMKEGTPMLMMPWTVKLSTALRGVLPIAAWDVVAGRVFGVYKSMEHFTGRK
ncbi:SDR family oxidoreductase [Arthrobacter psychrochitiniphilus]|uniref:3-oxoacyl-ACP reductase n=1 Tax=Arthrobacter psychrochitiniphilus TaxID=291045 RepID=A0A2V3DSL6_9MICC|nr:SDR family oxidoreductase [Arthrobacter psychrochitiniphilus]NYG18900.1 short-subunit dehydrogenase [Arthrobacter psychrochitiniphilus]PXA66198.1 3-oxoacyl-ACP reductase [Arthrobacter psychrochitiniphilus]